MVEAGRGLVVEVGWVPVEAGWVPVEAGWVPDRG